MKTITKLSALISATLLLCCFTLSAQTVKEQRLTAGQTFHGVVSGSVFSVYLTQGDQFSVEVEAAEEHMPYIETSINGGLLHIDYTQRARNLRNLEVRVTAPEFTFLHAGGASTIKSTNTLTANKMELKVSGASNMELDLIADRLTTNVSGASGIQLSGEAGFQQLHASGVSRVRAYDLQTEDTEVHSSGTSNVRVTANNTIAANASGTSTINVRGNPEVISYKTSGTASIRGVSRENAHADTNAETKESTVFRIGDTEISLHDDSRPTVRRVRSASWKNYWSGLYLGFNGYLSPENSLTLPAESSFMDMKHRRSLEVNLNMKEQKLIIARGENSLLGMVSGIGLTWNNYYLENNVRLVHGQEMLGYVDSEHNLRTNRLRVFSLKVPLMMQYQYHEPGKRQSFHMSAGIQGAVRLKSHTKVQYRVNDSKQTDRDRNDYYLSPYRLEAIGQIGWERLNLFATYSLTAMFKENKGPELYPFSVGIRLGGN